MSSPSTGSSCVTTAAGCRVTRNGACSMRRNSRPQAAGRGQREHRRMNRQGPGSVQGGTCPHQRRKRAMGVRRHPALRPPDGTSAGLDQIPRALKAESDVRGGRPRQSRTGRGWDSLPMSVRTSRARGSPDAAWFDDRDVRLPPDSAGLIVPCHDRPRMPAVPASKAYIPRRPVAALCRGGPVYGTGAVSANPPQNFTSVKSPET